MDPDEILDDEAIERFGRDLENDELAARAAAENEESEGGGRGGRARGVRDALLSRIP